MAAQMRAELCATLPQADATLAARAALPAIDVTTLTTLQALARRVARAERIASRTLERAVIEVGQRLAVTGDGLAVHPTTIRDRAAAVDAARAALADAEQALHAHAAEQAASLEAAEAAEQAGLRAAGEATRSPDVDEPPDAGRVHLPPPGTEGPSLRVRRSRALGVIVASFGLLLVALGLDLAPLWAALLLPLAASLWALRYLRPAEQVDHSYHRESSSLLAEISAITDDRFDAQRVGRDLADRATLLGATRDRAEEDLRVAERAWHELAGAEVDVDDVESVVRRFDPQHEDARVLAAETVGVRAADVVLHQFRQRWVAFWRELDLPAPDAAHGEQAVQDLATKVQRPIVLVGPATAKATEIARVAPAAPVVVLHGSADDEAGLS